METISDERKELQKGLGNAQNALTLSKYEVEYFNLLLKKKDTEEILSRDINLLIDYCRIDSNDQESTFEQTKEVFMKWCLKNFKQNKKYDEEIEELIEKKNRASKKLLNTKCDL